VAYESKRGVEGERDRGRERERERKTEIAREGLSTVDIL